VILEFEQLLTFLTMFFVHCVIMASLLTYHCQAISAHSTIWGYDKNLLLENGRNFKHF